MFIVVAVEILIGGASLWLLFNGPQLGNFESHQRRSASMLVLSCKLLLPIIIIYIVRDWHSRTHVNNAITIYNSMYNFYGNTLIVLTKL